jgi:hypothetical protein
VDTTVTLESIDGDVVHLLLDGHELPLPTSDDFTDIATIDIPFSMTVTLSGSASFDLTTPAASASGELSMTTTVDDSDADDGDLPLPGTSTIAFETVVARS